MRRADSRFARFCFHEEPVNPKIQLVNQFIFSLSNETGDLGRQLEDAEAQVDFVKLLYMILFLDQQLVAHKIPTY
jgi:hypothetical protein